MDNYLVINGKYSPHRYQEYSQWGKIWSSINQLQDANPIDLEKELDSMLSIGWELVSIVGCVAIFKRAK
jgi:hypothetical protein